MTWGIAVATLSATTMVVSAATSSPRYFTFGRPALISPTTTTTTTTNRHRVVQVDINSDLAAVDYYRSFIDDMITIRGGADESDEEYEEEEEDNDDEAETAIGSSDTVVSKILDVATLLGKAVIKTTKAIQRAIQAGLAGEESNEDDIEFSMLTKATNTVKRMIQAIFNGDDDSGDDVSSATISRTRDDSDDDGDDEEESEEVGGTQSDFGTYLSTTYNVEDNRGDKNGVQILGGSLNDALEVARSQARLLIVMIPSSRPNKKQRDTLDHQAIESLLSKEVSKASNKRARKKGLTTGSFTFWSAKFGSSEATTAVKRLKAQATNTKGGKRPFLLVVYPDEVCALDHDVFSL